MSEQTEQAQLIQDAKRWREVLRNPFAAIDAILKAVDSHQPSAVWAAQANAAIDARLK